MFLSLTQKIIAVQIHARPHFKPYEKSFQNLYSIFLYNEYFLIYGPKQKKSQNLQIELLKHQFVGPTGV